MKQREIKFRAWSIKRKQWIHNLHAIRFDGKLIWLGDVSREYEDNIENCIIQQYTGLHDKNGKEAYHKDKVSALGYDNWIIEWFDNGWKLKQEDIENYKDIPNDFIIIGNIFEK